MESISISTVNFCDIRLIPKEIDKIIQNYDVDCLSPEKCEIYKKLASAGEYIQVLGAIWRDKTNRLTFLRELAGEFHPLLMF